MRKYTFFYCQGLRRCAPSFRESICALENMADEFAALVDDFFHVSWSPVMVLNATMAEIVGDGKAEWIASKQQGK